MSVRNLPPELPVADSAPASRVVTTYDRDHLLTYLRLLDADDEGTNWTDVARMVLDIDPAREPLRARRAWKSHLARARWIVSVGIDGRRSTRRASIQFRLQRPLPAKVDRHGTNGDADGVASATESHAMRVANIGSGHGDSE